MNIKYIISIGSSLLLNLGITIQAQDTPTEKVTTFNQLAEILKKNINKRWAIEKQIEKNKQEQNQLISKYNQIIHNKLSTMSDDNIVAVVKSQLPEHRDIDQQIVDKHKQYTELQDSYKQMIQSNQSIIAEKIDIDCNKYLDRYKKSDGWLSPDFATQNQMLDKLRACSALSRAVDWSGKQEDVQKIVNFKEKVSSIDSYDWSLTHNRLTELQD